MFVFTNQETRKITRKPTTHMTSTCAGGNVAGQASVAAARTLNVGRNISFVGVDEGGDKATLKRHLMTHESSGNDLLFQEGSQDSFLSRNDRMHIPYCLR